jgi:Ca-activated chloride channel family protein
VSFITPAAFFLALLLPLIVLLYLLKLRRTERLVSSVYLWRRMVRDLEANAPWQRLRRNLLLFLQLLFLVVLILAIARPFKWVEGFSGRAAILILDTSASMGATDVSPSRIQAAKDQALRLVASLPEQTRITVITAGSAAQVLLSSSLDRRLINETIQKIQISMGTSDLAVAMQLAAAIAARQPETEIAIFSDGGGNLPPRLSVKGVLRFYPIGVSGHNQAISLFTLERSSGDRGVTAFVQVVNHGDSPAQRRLVLKINGALYNAYDISIPAGQEQVVIADELPIDTVVGEAQLLRDQSVDDYLESDDRALAILRPNVTMRVNLISQGNRFLETALSLLPGTELTRIDPKNEADMSPADLTIFDATIPFTSTPPTGNLLFIAPPSSTEFFTVTGTIQNPTPTPAEEDNGLLNYISLEGVNILDAVKISLPDWAKPIINATSLNSTIPSPLLFMGERQNRQIAVLAFDLQHSDLPLQIAFPILMANLLQRLAPGLSGTIPTQIPPGAAFTFTLPINSDTNSHSEALTLTKPDGREIQIQPQDGRVVFSDTSQLGLYTVALTDLKPIHFAVNMFLPEESTITPVKSLEIVGTQETGNFNEAQRSRQEWWRWIALFALALIFSEWLVYHRPTLVLLATKIRTLR